jgi:hypothetical protein
MTLSFRQFVELEKKSGNYIDGLWQELGIDRNALPDFIESGPIEIEDEGLLYNQAIWQILKPIDETDLYVRIKFFKTKSTDPNFVRAYVRRHDGKLMPYQGKVEGRIHLISIQKLAEILGKGWQAAAQAATAGGAMQ